MFWSFLSIFCDRCYCDHLLSLADKKNLLCVICNNKQNHSPAGPSTTLCEHGNTNMKQKLSGLLLRNGSIETLDLAHNPVGAEGLRRLSTFLVKNTRVETLGLRGCEIQPEGVKSGIYSLAQ